MFLSLQYVQITEILLTITSEVRKKSSKIEAEAGHLGQILSLAAESRGCSVHVPAGGTRHPCHT